MTSTFKFKKYIVNYINCINIHNAEFDLKMILKQFFLSLIMNFYILYSMISNILKETKGYR